MLSAAAPQILERVEITGSAIKRIEGESALPVTVITKQEIDQLGVVNAAQLVDKLVANSGQGYQLANALGDAARPGFSGASLRGLGSNSTLILLNGRRMSVYAFDGGAVNLQQIPFAAIERVEVLREGASAIYGTDAVAGVINFITRKDYSGCRSTAGPSCRRKRAASSTRPTSWPAVAISRRTASTSSACCRTPTRTRSRRADRDFAKTALRRDISIDPDVFGYPYFQGTSSNAFPGNILTPDGAFRNPYASAFRGAIPGCRDESIHRRLPERWLPCPAVSYGLTSIETHLPLRLREPDRHRAGQRSLVVPRPRDAPAQSEQPAFAEARGPSRSRRSASRRRRPREATTRQQPDGSRLPLLYPAGGPYYPGDGIVPAIPDSR